MILEYKNIGPVRQAQVEFGKLTMISGKNNTGKTILTYSAWRHLNKKQHGLMIVPGRILSIPNFDNNSDGLIDKFEIEYRALERSTYDCLSQCVTVYDLETERSDFYEQGFFEDIEAMLRSKFEYRGRNLGFASFNESSQMYHYYLSESEESLIDLYVYLKHYAKKGDLLLIDNPELGLHPEAQVKLARLFVRLINAGLRVWITTHSHYIIKELNNLLMLSRDFPGKESLMIELGYKNAEILQADDFRGYITRDDGLVQWIKIDDFGMRESAFDDIIIHTSSSSNMLASAIDNSL